VAAPAAKPAQGNGTPTPAAAQADPAAEQGEFEAAFKLLQQKKYKEAAAGFRGYLKKYPSGDNADSAQYWLGEALYVSEDNKGALAAFQTVLDKFPQSSKVPNALFKIGSIQHATGDRKKAEATLGRVVKQYPQTPAAKLAQQKLDAIRAEGR
jgi:tol-pal system protein YbgF